MRTSLVVSLSLLLTVAGASPALAQQGDAATKAAARTLAEDGVKLYDKGDYPGAFEKLNRANDLVHAPTMAYLVGQCLEKLGRLVEASEKYLEATHDVIEAGASPAQRTAQANAEKARQALLPRIPSVELILDPPVPDAAVVLDGKQVPIAMLGVKRLIDPGSHTVVATRWGQAASQSFTTREGDPPLRVNVKVPVGGYPPPSYAPGYPPGYPPGYAPPPQQRVEMKRKNLGLFVGGVVALPIGCIGILAGIGMLAVSGGRTAISNGSSPAGGAAVLVLSTGVVVGGSIMVAIGGKKVPVDAQPPAEAKPAAVYFEPLLGPTSGGLRVRF
jgi:hypothetical protein